MTTATQPASSSTAIRRVGVQFALRLLHGALMLGLVLQSPAFMVLASSSARTPTRTSQTSEEERPAESSETPAVHSAVSQGRKAARVLTTPVSALRMPLLNASGCMAARHHDGGRMLVCDIRLGTGLPLRL